MLAIEDKRRQHVPLSVYKEFPHFECFVISLCMCMCGKLIVKKQDKT